MLSPEPTFFEQGLPVKEISKEAKKEKSSKIIEEEVIQ